MKKYHIFLFMFLIFILFSCGSKKPETDMDKIKYALDHVSNISTQYQEGYEFNEEILSFADSQTESNKADINFEEMPFLVLNYANQFIVQKEDFEQNKVYSTTLNSTMNYTYDLEEYEYIYASTLKFSLSVFDDTITATMILDSNETSGSHHQIYSVQFILEYDFDAKDTTYNLRVNAIDNGLSYVNEVERYITYSYTELNVVNSKVSYFESDFITTNQKISLSQIEAAKNSDFALDFDLIGEVLVEFNKKAYLSTKSNVKYYDKTKGDFNQKTNIFRYISNKIVLDIKLDSNTVQSTLLKQVIEDYYESYDFDYIYDFVNTGYDNDYTNEENSSKLDIFTSDLSGLFNDKTILIDCTIEDIFTEEVWDNDDTYPVIYYVNELGNRGDEVGIDGVTFKVSGTKNTGYITVDKNTKLSDIVTLIGYKDQIYFEISLKSDLNVKISDWQLKVGTDILEYAEKLYPKNYIEHVLNSFEIEEEILSFSGLATYEDVSYSSNSGSITFTVTYKLTSEDNKNNIINKLSNYGYALESGMYTKGNVSYFINESEMKVIFKK